MRKIYAKILWDGVHGEPVEVEVTNKLYRMFRRAQRHRERFPHLYRQFYPRRLAKVRQQGTGSRRWRSWRRSETRAAIEHVATAALGGLTAVDLRGDLQA